MVEKHTLGIEGWAEVTNVVTAAKDVPAISDDKEMHTKAQQKSKAKAKDKAKLRAAFAAADPNKPKQVANPDLIILERKGKEILSEIATTKIEMDKARKKALAGTELAWMNNLFPQWSKLENELDNLIEPMEDFYKDFKASATSAKQIALVKKRYKERE